jgi:hypothetical protein
LIGRIVSTYSAPAPTNASAPAAPSRVPPRATPAAAFAWTSNRLDARNSVCVEEVEVVRVQRLEEQSKRFGIRTRYNAVFVAVTTFVTIPHSP